MRSDCYFCHIKTVERLIAKHAYSQVEANEFVEEINDLLGEYRDMKNPYLATLIHRKAARTLGNNNLFGIEKENANKLLLNRYEALKSLVLLKGNPLKNAIKLAIAGNIIDYGAHSVGDDIEDQLLTYYKQPLRIDQTDELIQALEKAKSVLYLGDNAGEIVCDKLLIETINHPNVTFVTRGKTVINDVTMHDATEVGMNSICKVISNGFDAPSTLPEHCSDEFRSAFETADLIISKGQGNFEGLMHHSGKNIFFLLMAKCRPIAELLNVNVNDLIVTNNSINHVV
jgi:damage-control phosphatase, subfamily I